LKETAVAAVRALANEFGAVDILEHPSGCLYVLESNQACYFASAQSPLGTDVSGAMVEYLLRKAQTLPSIQASLGFQAPRTFLHL
jgi:glutathione synthase/RimK-type ligase-like ATP-grasp enzyme